MIIERASALLDPAAVAAKLRHAPSWVKRGGIRSSPRPKLAGVLCGVAAPGVSVPCRCATDGRELSEVIDPAAWPEALAAITREKPVRLDSRHYGGSFASTASGTLRLSCHPLLGLLVEADVPDEPLARVIISNAGQRGVGLSVGFSHPKVEYQKVDGQTIRVVRRLRLDHVALVSAGQRPAYPGAVGMFAPAGDGRAIENASRDARIAAWHHVKAWRLKSASAR